MKKYLWIFIFISIIGIVVFLFTSNGDGQDEYTAERTGIKINNNVYENINLNNETAKLENKNIQEEIATFSTKLLKDTKSRDKNIELACKELNGTVVKKDETFSLWDTIGCPTKEKGYEKAKIFTSDGEIIKSYGGGICQISTTIYNAVLKVDRLEVKERHEHSREVLYIEDGKDAAVAYNTTDFKFKNTLDYDIKIEATVEDNKVNIKLIRI